MAGSGQVPGRFPKGFHFNSRRICVHQGFGWVLLSMLNWGASTHAAEKEAKPNIVFILADDLGGHDLGCYGSTFHRTPNLDALAKRGMLFTNAYSASPLCSPTRSSILTGLAPARIGITAPNCHLPAIQLEKRLVAEGPNAKVLVADSITRLKTEYATLPKSLKQAGYRTGHFGKWHLGAEPYSPLQHGFDIDLPHTAGPGPGGGNGYFAPWAYWKGEGKPGDHIEDRMAEEAVKFIKANKDRPFFLNYWAFGVHSPWMGRKEYVEEAAKRADPKAPQRNPVYAAMIRSLDDAVGRIVATLEENKLADNTIIVFTSDNGGWHNVAKEATDNAAYAGIPVTSNAPLRSGKASNYEGGTHVPLLVLWPGKTKAGSRNETVAQSTDFFPTLLEMANIEPPSGVKFDGTSIAPAFLGGPVKREAIFSHFPHGGRADIDGFRPGTWVRKGDWKLIRFFADNPDGRDKLELYNLKDDIGEAKNLAAEKPEMAKELNGMIAAFLKDTDAVVPKLNPKFQAPPAAPSGWQTSKDAKLEVKEGAWILASSGGDPYMAIRDLPAGTGPFTLELRMKSNSRGSGQVFWMAAEDKVFHRDRSAAFEPKHDGEWQTCEIKLPTVKPLTGLRDRSLDGPRGNPLRDPPHPRQGRQSVEGLATGGSGEEVARDYKATFGSPPASVFVPARSASLPACRRNVAGLCEAGVFPENPGSQTPLHNTSTDCHLYLPIAARAYQRSWRISQDIQTQSNFSRHHARALNATPNSTSTPQACHTTA